MENHTPTPWSVNTDTNYEDGLPGIVWGIDGPGRGAVCHTTAIYPSTGWPVRKFNGDAEFIVRACNSHQKLVDALEDIELRLTQARIASTIGPQSGKHGQKKVEFLRNETDRIGKIARAAIAEADKITNNTVTPSDENTK